MGNLCSARSTQPSIIRRESVLSTIKDFQFSNRNFIQENFESFQSVYSLNESPIGTGAFAEVWLCTHKRTDDVRAVKVFKKSEISYEEIASRAVFAEVEILKSLDHPNILKVFEYFEDSEHFYIVMEYCQGGDVFDKIERCGKLTEKLAAKILKYLLVGVNYLHSKNVVHRDIKPENILITNKDNFKDLNIKIIDFNVATVKVDRNLRGITGTTDYMAPEVFSGVYNEKCDLWSCGIVLYLMVTGNLPFASGSEEEAERAIRTEKLKFPNDLFQNISKPCIDLISKLLQKKSSARPTAFQALSHPWLKLAEESVDKRLISNTIRRMASNSYASKLKEVFTTFILSQISNSASLKKFEKIFYAIDVDKNGVITKDELVHQLSLEMKKEEAEERANKMMSLIDNDGSGEIDFTEFLKAAVDEKTLLTKENLRKAFLYFDKDKSNAIEKEELTQWLCTGGGVPEEIVDELMEEADRNGDGTIDIEEFEALLAEKLEI